MRKIYFIVAAVATLAIGCTKEGAQFPKQTIADMVNNNAEFSILKTAITKAGLGDALKTEGITLYAPNNAAFSKAGITEAAINSMNTTTLSNILRYHVVANTNSIGGFAATGTAVNTLNGSAFFGHLLGVNRATVNGKINVTRPNMIYTNGVVNVIDNVMMPPVQNIMLELVASPNHRRLVQAIDRCNLRTTLSNAGPFCVFAPTDAAFAQAGLTEAVINSTNVTTLTNILLTHVVSRRVFTADFMENGELVNMANGRLRQSNTSGPRIRSNGTSQFVDLTNSDMKATNGLIHVINRVLLP